MKIARVFPSKRRTAATPSDGLAFVNCGPGLFPPDVDEVHISVTFSWDLPRAQELAQEWESVAPVKIGGPATGMRGEAFTPGMYLKPGYVITSRGCPNRCSFCQVPWREGGIREIPITEGCNVLDDNLLACSQKHIFDVVDMLRRQKLGRPQFTGGLEAARFTPEFAEAIRSVNPVQVFFAYDEPKDWEPLVRAAELCKRYRYALKGHHVRAYVLCGYRAEDTVSAASERMEAVMRLGILPMAMVWRGRSGRRAEDWAKFQRLWTRPAIAAARSAA